MLHPDDHRVSSTQHEEERYQYLHLHHHHQQQHQHQQHLHQQHLNRAASRLNMTVGLVSTERVERLRE